MLTLYYLQSDMPVLSLFSAVSPTRSRAIKCGANASLACDCYSVSADDGFACSGRQSGSVSLQQLLPSSREGTFLKDKLHKQDATRRSGLATWQECLQTTNGAAAVGEPSVGRLDVCDFISSKLFNPSQLLHFSDGHECQRLGTVNHRLEDKASSSERDHVGRLSGYSMEHCECPSNDVRQGRHQCFYFLISQWYVDRQRYSRLLNKF